MVNSTILNSNISGLNFSNSSVDDNILSEGVMEDDVFTVIVENTNVTIDTYIDIENITAIITANAGDENFNLTFGPGRVNQSVKVTVTSNMLGYVLGNSFYTADLLRHGRGQYVDAMKHMVENTPDDVVTIGSDHDFRNRAMVDFYAPRLASAKSVSYYKEDAWPPGGLDWVILHSWAGQVAPPATVTDSFGHVYSLNRSYPYARLSGWHWFLYRRER